MRLSHNMASLSIYRQYSKVLVNQSKSLQKISSGIKVNKAKDDPNALARSEKLRMQVRGLQMAYNNVQDGVSMLQAAEGGLDGVTSMLQRIRQLTVQAGSGTNNADDNASIQNEINEMVKGIDTTSKNTDFNGVKLLQVNDGESTVLNMEVGANPDEKAQINRINLVSDGDLKLVDKSTGKSNIDISSAAAANNTLQVIDAALATTISARSEYGALENRFQSSITSLGQLSDKTEEADSQLRDTDVAGEMAEYSKSNILAEAGNAMMAQSNKLPQDVLSMLKR